MEWSKFVRQPEEAQEGAEKIPEGTEQLQAEVEDAKELLGEFVNNPKDFETLTSEESEEVGGALKRVIGGFAALVGAAGLTVFGAGGYEMAMKVAEANDKFFGGGDHVLTTELGMSALAALAAISTIIGSLWLFEKKK